MKKKFAILAGLTMFAASAAVTAQPADGPRRDRNVDVSRQQVIERSEQRFARLDLNNDGQVTAEEAQGARQQRRAQNAGRAFDRLDLDRNGNITRVEFEQARGEVRQRRGERSENRGGQSTRRGHQGDALRAGRMFGDRGFITREQFNQRALARFDRQDRDRNGVVSVAERRESMERRGERRQEPRD